MNISIWLNIRSYHRCATLLGVGPFGVVVFLELRGPRGVLGAVRGVRGPLLIRGWREQILGVLGAVAGDLGVLGCPSPPGY